MYLVITKDDEGGSFGKQDELSDGDLERCENNYTDIIDISEPNYPKYYADGEWWGF